MIDNKPSSRTDSNRATKDAGGPVVQPAAGTFGRYQLVRELGRGGMGVVYMALDPSLKRHVALKIVNQSFASDREKKRFENETYVMAKLSHPNIVKIFDVGEEQGRHFFTMELVAGIGLNRLLEESIPQPRLLQIMVKVAQAVHHAHQQGVIHRDLKPSNIMVMRDDEPKVMDFGLAKEIAGNQQLSQSQDAIGTPYYMSPEQAGRRGRDIDARSDVFALGVILYQIVTGKLPFTGDTPVNVMYQISFYEPPAPSHYSPGMSRELEAICIKALEKEKDRRYKSAAAFADDLSRYLAGQPVEAKSVTRWIRLGKWVRRHRIAALGSAAASCLLMAAVVFFLYREHTLRQLAEHQTQEAIRNGIEAERQKQEAIRNGIEAERQKQEAIRNGIEARLNLAESELVLAKNRILAQEYAHAYNGYRKVKSLLSADTTRGNVSVNLPAQLASKHQFLETSADNMWRYLIAVNPHRTCDLLLSPDLRGLSMRVEADGSGDQVWQPVHKQLGGLGNLAADFADYHHISLRMPNGLFMTTTDNPSWDMMVFWRLPHLGRAVLWDVAQYKQASTFDIINHATVVAFSDAMVALGDRSGNVTVYDGKTGQRHLLHVTPQEKLDPAVVENKKIRKLQFSPNGKWLFASVRAKFVVWQVPEMKEALARTHSGMMPGCAFSQNGKWMAIGGTSNQEMMNTYLFYLDDLAKKPMVFNGHADTLCFGAADRMLIAADSNDIRLYPTEQNKMELPITILNAHQGEIYDLAISPDGNFFASVGQDGKVILWNSHNYSRAFSWKLSGNSSQPCTLRFHPQTAQLGVWSQDAVNIYSWHTGLRNSFKLFQQEKMKEGLWDVVKTMSHSNVVRTMGNKGVSICISPRDDAIACNSIWSLYLADIAGHNMQLLVALQEHFRSFEFSHDGSLLLCRWRDRVMVWETASRLLLLDSQKDRRFSPWALWQPQSGNLIAVETQPQDTLIIKFWDIRSQKLLQQIQQRHTPCDNLRFDPSGKRILVDHGRDMSIIALHDTGYEKITTLHFDPALHSDKEKTAVFAGDRHVALGTAGGDLVVYDLNLPKPVWQVSLGEPVKQLWYDENKRLYWIFTGNRLLIYPHLTDTSMAETVERIYPLAVLANYPLMACDLSYDFNHAALVLLSWEVLLFGFPPSAAKTQSNPK